jgi:hypothetical protein
MGTFVTKSSKLSQSHIYHFNMGKVECCFVVLYVFDGVKELSKLFDLAKKYRAVKVNHKLDGQILKDVLLLPFAKATHVQEETVLGG